MLTENSSGPSRRFARRHILQLGAVTAAGIALPLTAGPSAATAASNAKPPAGGTPVLSPVPLGDGPAHREPLPGEHATHRGLPALRRPRPDAAHVPGDVGSRRPRRRGRLGGARTSQLRGHTMGHLLSGLAPGGQLPATPRCARRARYLVDGAGDRAGRGTGRRVRHPATSRRSASRRSSTSRPAGARGRPTTRSTRSWPGCSTSTCCSATPQALDVAARHGRLGRHPHLAAHPRADADGAARRVRRHERDVHQPLDRSPATPRTWSWPGASTTTRSSCHCRSAPTRSRAGTPTPTSPRSSARPRSSPRRARSGTAPSRPTSGTRSSATTRYVIGGNSNAEFFGEPGQIVSTSARTPARTATATT